MNSIKNLIKKIDKKKVINASLFLAGATCLVVANAHTAFAAPSDLGLQGQTASQVTTTVYKKAEPAIKAVAALGVAGALATVGIGIVMSNKKPEDRAAIMGRVPWIAGGAIICSCIAMFTGWILQLAI